MAQISKIERILNLVAYLFKERQPVPWREISGKVVGYDDGGDPKSLERRFERDKAALKELGIPIRFFPAGTHDRDGYLISREDCFLDALELSAHEVTLLNLLTELGARRGERSEELLSALQKLRFEDGQEERRGGLPSPDPDELPDGDRAGETAWQRWQLRLDKVQSLRRSPHLDRLTEAILTNRAVRFTYYAISTGETRERRVDPYGLGFARGAWYLVGRDHDRDAPRRFRLSRIRGGVATVGEPGAFAVPSGFKVSDHIGLAPWMMGQEGVASQEVRLLVDRDIAWFAEGPMVSKTTEDQPDGSAILAFDVRDEEAFLRWLLGHARHVRVLEPARVRERFAAALEEVAARHA